MATNLRLSPEAEAALRDEAQRTGRSQQQIIRDALDLRLGLLGDRNAGGGLTALVATGAVLAPRTPYRKPAQRIKLPAGVTSAELLDRTDRI